MVYPTEKRCNLTPMHNCASLPSVLSIDFATKNPWRSAGEEI
ncbi:MAG: hypothetical protein V7K15_27345 [Nostoc sp.]